MKDDYVRFAERLEAAEAESARLKGEVAQLTHELAEWDRIYDKRSK